MTKDATAVDSALSDKILKQIEYYFGDVNLSKDKFLQEEIQKDSGWVALETLIKFNRLKQLSTDFQVIIDALKKSTNDLIEIDEENKKIRRAKPLPENLSEFETNLKQNTVYVKGFPSEVTLDQLYEYFEQYGKVLQIFMRRFPTTRQFKGSIFVTFETSEQMKAFQEKEEIKYAESVLSVESQEKYLERKAPELEKIKESKRRKEQQKEDKEKQKQEAEEAYLKEQQVAGAILHLKSLNSEATRENIKELFDNYAKVKYIDFNKGQVEGYVRFAEANKAKEALEKATESCQGELSLKGGKVEARVLEGEEEEEYWKTIVRKLSESRGRNKNKNKGKRGGKGAWNNNKKSYNKKGKRELDGDGDDDDDNDNDDGGNSENGEATNGNSNKKLKTADEN